MTGARLDILIVTHERRALVRTLLEGLSGCGPEAFGRVVVVDDSSVPSVRPTEFPDLPIDLVRPEGRILVAEARNLGLARSTSEYLFLFDDDNRVLPETVAEPLRFIDSSHRIGAVMPSVLYARRPDLVWVYATPFRPGRWGFEQIGRNRRRDPAWDGRTLPTDALPNAAIYRRDLLRSLGGWDPRLPFGSSADLCQRIKAHGAEAWADSRSFTYHDVELPERWGSWAQHATDPTRLRQDLRDWYVFLRQLHGDTGRTRFESFVRTAPSNARLLAALSVRRPPRWAHLVWAFAQGIRAGLSDPVGPGYGPLE